MMDGIAMGLNNASNPLLVDPEFRRMELEGNALPHLHHTRA
jgi:hypothetical protein